MEISAIFGNLGKESPGCKGDTEQCSLYTIAVCYFKRLSKYKKKIIRKITVIWKRLELCSDSSLHS